MNERILVVEDEAITALDLKYSLEEIGYEVIDTVDTGQDAIDIAEEVISQWNIPIIYLTANTDIDTFEQSKVKGVYGFVSKPYDLNKLNETLKDTFEKVKSEKITDV